MENNYVEIIKLLTDNNTKIAELLSSRNEQIVQLLTQQNEYLLSIDKHLEQIDWKLWKKFAEGYSDDEENF